VKLSAFDLLWLAAAAVAALYPLGDLLGWWEIEPLVVLIAAPAMLLASRFLSKDERLNG
jgi:membrane protein implicated in regulation of membrane protease activity